MLSEVNTCIRHIKQGQKRWQDGLMVWCKRKMRMEMMRTNLSLMVARCHWLKVLRKQKITVYILDMYKTVSTNICGFLKKFIITNLLCTVLNIQFYMSVADKEGGKGSHIHCIHYFLPLQVCIKHHLHAVPGFL